jgi:hypothetical protein
MSTTPTPRRRFRDTRLSRFLQARWRLVFATLVCAALIALLPDGFLLVTRFLIGWDAGVALYLVLVTVMVLRSDPGRIRREADLQDEGRLTIPVLTVAAGMASLGAIVFWLRSASESGSTQPLYLGLMFLTTLLSWLFIHTMFAAPLRARILRRASWTGRWHALSRHRRSGLLGFRLFLLRDRNLHGRVGRRHHLAHDQADRDGPWPRGVRLQRDDDRFDGFDRGRRDLFQVTP